MHDFIFGAYLALTLCISIFCSLMWDIRIGLAAFICCVGVSWLYIVALVDIHNWRYRREMKRRDQAYWDKRHYIIKYGLCPKCENTVSEPSRGDCNWCDNRTASFSYKYCWDCAERHRCCARCGR